MARILVVDDTPMILQLVTLSLKRSGHEVQTAENGLAGVAAAKEWRPDLIIMDVMMPEMDGYEATRQIRKTPSIAHIPILILSAQEGMEEKLHGFEAGADDYLTKPFEPVELNMRVTVHLKRAQASLAAAAARAAAEAPKKSGYVIACFSLRGGSGVSTLAVNLSLSLARIWSQPCALIDLALTGGHDSLLLNLPLKRTWADLAVVPENELDSELVEQHLSEHPAGVRVLASPSHPEDGELVKAGHVSEVLRLLRLNYDYVVIDLPHDFRETSLTVLDAADVILMPFPPDLASVRSAVAALHALDTLKYPPGKVRLILNWTFAKFGLAQADIERYLKIRFDLIIPHDSETLIKAINLGQPLVLSPTPNPLATMLEDYAFRISRPEDINREPEKKSVLYERVVRQYKSTAASAKK
jgi:pilus assembly protein CpaE